MKNKKEKAQQTTPKPTKHIPVLDAKLLPKPLNIKQYNGSRVNAKPNDSKIKENKIGTLKITLGNKYFPSELPRGSRVLCRNIDYVTLGDLNLENLTTKEIVMCNELVKLVKLPE